MWKVMKILEADYGCEERQPGESLQVLVYLENEHGERKQLSISEDFLFSNHIEEGSIWPQL